MNATQNAASYIAEPPPPPPYPEGYLQLLPSKTILAICDIDEEARQKTKHDFCNLSKEYPFLRCCVAIFG